MALVTIVANPAAIAIGPAKGKTWSVAEIGHNGPVVVNGIGRPVIGIAAAIVRGRSVNAHRTAIGPAAVGHPAITSPIASPITPKSPLTI
jgi:hypothetical protein